LKRFTHVVFSLPYWLLFCALTLTSSLTHARTAEKPTTVQNTVLSQHIAQATHTILVMGDSISAGLGIDPQKGWVALLGKELNQSDALSKRRANKIHIVNASISGETTSGGRYRLTQALKKYHPILVIIELGGNDGLRGTPIKSISANLSAMVAASQANGAKVMLLGMRIPPNYGERYTQQFAAIYAELAKTHSTLFVPFLMQDIAGKTGMMQDDGIHPTELAQPLMTELVRKQLTAEFKTQLDCIQ